MLTNRGVAPTGRYANRLDRLLRHVILVGSRDEPFSQEPWMSGHVPRDITVGHPEVTGKRTIGRRLGPDRTGASSMLATRWVSWTARPGQRVRQVRVIAASPGNRCHICDQRQAESVAGMPRGARRAARCWDRAHANVARKPPMKAARPYEARPRPHKAG